MMKARRLAWLLAPLAALAAVACGTLPDNRRDGATALSVVTLNLYHDKDDWPKRQALIVATLRKLHPDVIALEEVLQHEGLPNQAETLGAALGYSVHFVSVDPEGGAKRFGNAILTRHPVLARDAHPLQPLDDYRIAGFVRIDLDGRPVNIYVTHLHYTDAGGAIRARQVRDLLEFVAATAGNAPSLIAGDFNAAADTPELELLRVAGYVDSYGAMHPEATRDPAAHATLNRKYFPDDRRRIDHVFLARAAFEPTASRIILDQPDAAGTWASDHYGLLTTTQLLPPAPR
jgi:beta-glucosidase